MVHVTAASTAQAQDWTVWLFIHVAQRAVHHFGVCSLGSSELLSAVDLPATETLRNWTEFPHTAMTPGPEKQQQQRQLLGGWAQPRGRGCCCSFVLLIRARTVSRQILRGIWNFLRNLWSKETKITNVECERMVLCMFVWVVIVLRVCFRSLKSTGDRSSDRRRPMVDQGLDKLSKHSLIFQGICAVSVCFTFCSLFSTAPIQFCTREFNNPRR